MFNINVDVFIYNSAIYSPRWQRTSPDAQIAEMIGGSWNDGTVTDIYLYHSEFTHYDLIIPRTSAMAKYGPISGILGQAGPEEND